MKELSKEEKAKRYDEALEELRGLLEGIREEKCKILEEDITSIFPELKESEDEKIRKVLVYYLKNYKKQRSDTTRFYGIPTDNVLAWLEKQGENHDDKYNITGIKSKHAEGKLGEMIKEIKSTNKAEPKFHEGQWLCENESNNYARFIQILEIVNVQGKERYRISRDIHNDEDIVEFDFVEKYYHKFDIKDAKDGDILASKSGDKIFSYRGNLDLRGNPCAYYGIYKVHDGICFSPCAIGNSFTHEEVFPATKEQRKILFEEMTAAKGVLHFNKKELKKK